MNNKYDIAVINGKIHNHFAEYMVTNFMNILMSEGDKTDAAINDVLSKDVTRNIIHELLPNVDTHFIRKMIAALTSNSDFCEAMHNMQMSKEETENIIIEKLTAGFSKQDKSKTKKPTQI